MNIILLILKVLRIDRWVLNVRPHCRTMNAVRCMGLNVWVLLSTPRNWLLRDVPAVVIQPSTYLFTIGQEWTPVTVRVYREVTAVADHMTQPLFWEKLGSPLFLEEEWDFEFVDGDGKVLTTIPATSTDTDLSIVFPDDPIDTHMPVVKEVQAFYGL